MPNEKTLNIVLSQFTFTFWPIMSGIWSSELAKMIGGEFEFIAKREGEAEVTFADNRKAGEILGWEPEGDLRAYIDSELKNG